MVLQTVADFENLTGVDALTTAETKLIAACRAGEVCELEGGERPDTNTAARRIRASLLRLLIVGGSDSCGVADRGVSLIGGWIVGELNLDFAKGRGFTSLINCHFTTKPQLISTDLGSLNLSGSKLPGLFAQGLKVAQGVLLRDGFHATGTVDLSGAEIGGQLDCSAGHFYRDGEKALNGQGVKVAQDVFLSDGFRATGTVDLSGAEIGGQLACLAGRFDGVGGNALNGQRVKVAQGVFLSHGFRATGTVDLSGANIRGPLACSAGHFDGNGGNALNGQSVKVAQGVHLSHGFHTTGTVDLNAAEIGGQFACSDGHFDGNGEEALNGQSIKVAQDVFLREGFHATGTVDLSGAEIGGQLDCTDGRFEGNGKNSLAAVRVNVTESFLWQNVKMDNGAVDLEGAHVRDLVDDLASWPDGVGLLNLDGLTYDRIATFTDTEKRLEWLQNGAIWNGKFYPQPFVQLAKTLREQGHKRDALRISYVAEKIGRTHERKQLLINPDGTIKTGVERVKANLKRVGFALLDRPLRAIVGYGLYPFRSVLWLALLIVLATIPAHFAWDEGSMVPNSGPVLVSSDWLEVANTQNPAITWSLTDPGKDWETFNRYAWAADLVIPIVDLSQTAAWTPSTERGPVGYHLWWGRWALIIFGWIITALGAAAITGIIRRE